MKKVFSSTQEVCHVYTSNSQSEGRTSSGNVYFNQNTIYSYGNHFPMARRLDDGSYLVTYRRYSVSTSKHLSELHSALRHALIRYCYNPAQDAEYNLEMERSEFEQVLAAITAVKYPKGRGASRITTYSAELNHIAERTKTLCAVLSAPVPAWCELSGDVLEQSAIHAVRKEQEQKEQAAARAKLIKKQQREARAYLKDWRKDTAIRTQGMNNLPVALRIVGEEVQTSHGARITFEEVRASKIWPTIKYCHDNKCALEFNTQRKPVLGYYKADAIDAKGTLYAGCHTIPFVELEAVARVIFSEEVAA